MSILDDARKILESAGYMTISGQGQDTFYFEDGSLLGFVWEAPSVTILLSGWQKKQDDFLKQQDHELRKAKEKSWNVYSVLLTEDEGTQEQLSELARTEEDFRGTRKIARSGVRATSQVVRALLPVLPIQNLLSLGESDAMSRLHARLGSISGKVAQGLLQETATDRTIDLIVDSDENP